MRERVAAILAQTAAGGELGSRIEQISRRLLGHGYLPHALPAKSDGRESLRVNLAAFDCVTFCETVLALAASRAPADFPHHLLRLRYRGSEARWADRNHYFSEWIKSNIRKSYLSGLAEIHTGIVLKTLSVVDGIPEISAILRVIPYDQILSGTGVLKTGDVVAFVPAWTRLDVFHCGLLVVHGADMRLRHAARSRGGVCEEPLPEFLGRCRLLGTIVARPKWPEPDPIAPRPASRVNVPRG